jgi:hypothetical protein
MSAAAAGTAPPVVPAAITVPPAFKKLAIIVAGMFYSGQCPPAWWVDAADPKKDAPDPEHAMFQQEKKAAQIMREAKRKAQVNDTHRKHLSTTMQPRESFSSWHVCLSVCTNVAYVCPC